jgi:hypothetical protein
MRHAQMAVNGRDAKGTEVRRINDSSKVVRLDDLLARFDPVKHRHEPILDDAPAGRETPVSDHD